MPGQVAELAAELSEAQSPSRRKRLARQIPQLASRSRQASWNGLQSGSQASVRGLRSGSQASLRGLKSGGQAAWTGLQTGGSGAGRGLQAVGRRLTSEVLEMAPKIPIRDITTLREQYPGLSTEQLADALIEGAARASAGVGAAVGAAAAVPFIPTMPVELGVETLLTKPLLRRDMLAALERCLLEREEMWLTPMPGPVARNISKVGSTVTR